MKLTTKQIMLLLMSILLVLVIVMGSIVLNRVSGFLQILSGPGSTTAATDPTPNNDGTPTGTLGTEASSEPTVPTQPTEPHEHKYVKDKTVSATCTDYGYTLYSCSCGRQDVRNMVDAKGHLLGPATVVPATCEQDGYTEQICSRCDQAIRTDVQLAGHKFNDWTAASVLVGDSATQEQRTCSTCKCIEIRNTATPDEWTIRRYASESFGNYTTYKVVVDFPDDDGLSTDVTYQVYTKLENKTIHYNYSAKGANAGLTLTYFVNSAERTYTAPATGDRVVTIDNKGNVTLKAPDKEAEEPTTPSEPSTKPSQPRTDPSTTPTGSTGPTPTESTGTTTGSTPTESTGTPTTGTTGTESTDPQA